MQYFLTYSLIFRSHETMLSFEKNLEPLLVAFLCLGLQRERSIPHKLTRVGEALTVAFVSLKSKQ